MSRPLLRLFEFDLSNLPELVLMNYRVDSRVKLVSKSVNFYFA